MAGEPSPARRPDGHEADLAHLASGTDMADATARAALARRLRAEYESGRSVRDLVAAASLPYDVVRLLLTEAVPAPAQGQREAAQRVLADLAARGAVVPPEADKAPPPEPLAAARGLSDLVIAHRG